MEWVSELVGFLIILFIFMLPLFRKILIDKRQKKEEPRVRIEQEIEEEEKETQPVYETPDRLVKKNYAFESSIEVRQFGNKISQRELEIQADPNFDKRLVSRAFILDKPKKRKRVKNPLTRFTENKDPLQAMVILSEILGSPRGS